MQTHAYRLACNKFVNPVSVIPNCRSGRPGLQKLHESSHSIRYRATCSHDILKVSEPVSQLLSTVSGNTAGV